MQLECHSEYKPLKIFISRKCLKSLRRPGEFLSIWGVEALNAVNTADSQVQVPFPKRHQNGVVRHDYFGVVLCLDKTLSWVREWQKDRGDARPMLGGMGSPRKVGARYAAHASISISQSHLGGKEHVISKTVRLSYVLEIWSLAACMVPMAIRYRIETSVFGTAVGPWDPMCHLRTLSLTSLPRSFASRKSLKRRGFTIFMVSLWNKPDIWDDSLIDHFVWRLHTVTTTRYLLQDSIYFQNTKPDNAIKLNS